MEKLTKVVCAVALTYFMCGFGYQQYQECNTHYEVRQFVEVIHAGDTIDGIMAHYHNEANEGKSFGEWKFETLRLPENKHLLNEKGYLKTYYPGQKLYMRCRIKVAE